MSTIHQVYFLQDDNDVVDLLNYDISDEEEEEEDEDVTTGKKNTVHLLHTL